MAITAPRGTRDILPEEIPNWRYLEQVFEEVCHLFDFHEIRLPTFEATEVFARGVGDSSDIVRKEMYTFLDKSDRSMTLRPEGTAGVVRSFIEQGMSSWRFPVRLFYNLNLFRYERVAKGRYREFHQFGVEAFGSTSPKMDVEIISLLDIFFKKLGLKSMSLHINSLGTPACRALYNKALQSYLKPSLDHLCGDCRVRFEKNPMRILDCKVASCRHIIEGAPRLVDYLDEESKEHFELLKQGLDDLGIEYVVDLDIVRGLDYYSRTVFEFVSENVGTQGTICGGGRYDSLIAEMGGPEIPGVGFAIGVERLLMEMQAQGLAAKEMVKPAVFVAYLDQEAGRAAVKLVKELRLAGIAAQTELCDRTLKAQMKFANKLDARYVLVLGETELQSGKAQVRRMCDGEQVDLSWQSIESWQNLLDK